VTAAQKIIPFPKKEIARRSEHELAFLPAALEIVETPPSPIGRAIGITVISLFSLALAWATFGTVDIVATASGKIIPSGRTKIVQPFEIGVVSRIHVRDGQSVKAGEVLIELDPTMTRPSVTTSGAISSRPGSKSPGCARHCRSASIRSMTSIRQKAPAGLSSR
jgi:hemolysin D